MRGMSGTRRRGGALTVAAVAALALAAPAGAGTPNTWSETGAMATGRGGPAVLLSNGNVLEAGGTTGSTSSDNTAEIYNTSTGTFSAAASMNVGRVAPAAVVLQSGKVLVLGGRDTGADNTAEVYNPTANTWTPTLNNMSISGGEFPAAALLSDGRVLVVGGDQGPASTSADIYNPATNSFTAAAPMTTAREVPAAITLPSGKVLVVGGGGDGSGTVFSSAEVYDPTANSWTPVANNMSSPREGGGMSVLPGGKVLVAGGIISSISFATTASADIYTPATNSFTPAASMSASRYIFGLTALADGRVLAAGGLVLSGSIDFLAGAELYDATSNTWSAAGSLNEGRAAQGQTLLGNGQVLAAGGIVGVGAPGLASAELYTPTSAPSAPQAVSASAGNGQVSVTWAPPAFDGGSPIQHYTVTASTGQTVSTTDARTVATVTGLQNGRAVTFTVTATNAIGTGAASAASNSVTPTGPQAVTPTGPQAVTPTGPQAKPKVSISGVKSKLKLKSFLHGLKVKLGPNEPVSLQVSLLAFANRATIARAFNLTLATRKLGLSGSKRTVKLVPSKRLVGKAKRFKVQLVVVATSSAGNRVTETKVLSIKG
jgi:hypothetical protein